jgi:gas vesicle protein
LERIKWLQHSNQAIFGGTVCTKDPSIENDNTNVSINVTKPEETTTKVIEKHKDSIKAVIQDTMKTIHENIDKVQSNVEKVQTDVRSLEQGWRNELNSALDKVKL